MIPGAKIPHGSRPKNQNRKQKQYCNKFNKDLKNEKKRKKESKSESDQVLNRKTKQGRETKE